MTHQIALDPSLGLSAGQFAVAWNGMPDSRELATATVAPDAARSYDPAWAEIVNLIVVPLALGVAGNALYDLIKRTLLEAGVHRRTRIIHQKRSDGTELIIIAVDEDA